MVEIAALVIKIPSNTVYKKATEYLNVDVEYEYRGPAQRVYFTAVVTQETFYGEFDEIGSTKRVVYVDLPSSDTLKPYTTRVPNLPLSGVEPKATAYGVKIKAEGTFGTVEAGNKACLYVEEEVVEEYALTITIDPPVGGTVTKSPDKTKYTYGEFVTLTATPSSGYKFDHWSGDASGYSPSVTIAMIRDRSVVAHFQPVVVGISFQMSIWGVPDFGSYQKWCCHYWDPGINDFVGDGKWYYSYQKIAFSNVKTGGYLAVFLKRNETVSPQYNSPTFEAVDGGIYQYDVYLGRVIKIG